MNEIYIWTEIKMLFPSTAILLTFDPGTLRPLGLLPRRLPVFATAELRDGRFVFDPNTTRPNEWK